MKNIYAIASISSFSMEVADYPFGINENGNNKFKDQLLKLCNDPRSFEADNFVVDAMYVEAIKQGSAVVCDDGSICMGGVYFSRTDKYSSHAVMKLQELLLPLIELKIHQAKTSIGTICGLSSFGPMIDEIEEQLSGKSKVKMNDFIEDVRDRLREVGENLGDGKSGNIEAFLDVLSDDNIGNYPKELILMFMIFIVLMILTLIETMMKMNEQILEAME